MARLKNDKELNYKLPFERYKKKKKKLLAQTSTHAPTLSARSKERVRLQKFTML